MRLLHSPKPTLQSSVALLPPPSPSYLVHQPLLSSPLLKSAAVQQRVLLQVRRVARLMAEVENHDFMREADAPHHVPPWARAEVRAGEGQRCDLGWARAQVRTRGGQLCLYGEGRGASMGQGRGAS